MDSWVKFYRKIIENGWLKNHKLFICWCYCLLKASHKKHKVIIGFQEVILYPGQFIFGYQKASKETNLSIQSLRTCLRFLKTAGNITIKVTNKYSIVTIVNWAFYQGIDPVINNQTNKQVTSNQQASNKQVTTYKNGKNGKNGKKEKKTREKFSPPCIEILTMEFQSRGITGEAGKKEAELFFNFYDSKNWYVGKNKMVRWKSAVAGWIARKKEREQRQPKKESHTQQVDNPDDYFIKE